jgi:exosortase A-associated hydrolase 2
MNPLSGPVPAEPFFLKTGLGERFCLFYPPAAGKCHGSLLYVHPFGDEMNKARRMVALQSRQFAALGFGVLHMDLLGCGDSSGEFGEASWEQWKEDLALGNKWLQDRLDKPVSLWGLRLGALLALDYARTSPYKIDSLILWQPVLNGASYLTQLLRLRVANEMLGDGKEKNGGTQAMREALKAGETLEIAGYDIAPALALAIDSLEASDLFTTTCPVHWFEVVSAANRPMTPAGLWVSTAWEKQGVDLHTHIVPCLPFWATQEISECPELLSATSAIAADVSSISRMASHEL